jgi:hypothetical protein
LKNRTDDGKIHYDASTNENIVERLIRFEHRKSVVSFVLRTPRTIAQRLTQTDYDTAEEFVKRTYDEQFVTLMRNGEFNRERMDAVLNQICQFAMCEHLYNCFLMDQHHKGNERWEIPKTMQKVGRDPNLDKEFCEVAHG